MRLTVVEPGCLVARFKSQNSIIMTWEYVKPQHATAASKRTKKDSRSYFKITGRESESRGRK
jgi:hypothetical protein